MMSSRPKRLSYYLLALGLFLVGIVVADLAFTPMVPRDERLVVLFLGVFICLVGLAFEGASGFVKSKKRRL